ncbi:hypothetical protein AB0L05_17340 [Nonomuraea pusilla]|uniref:hypothetical protein n=1 Tax=Nonomuraea pusilla TaxID=46177 RepID=UPI00332315B7
MIREVARRKGLGWPAIVLMALAYGVLEEGVMTMSLFNPRRARGHGGARDARRGGGHGVLLRQRPLPRVGPAARGRGRDRGRARRRRVPSPVGAARPRQGGGHRVALAGGALLTYAWHAFFSGPPVPTTPAMNLASHVVFGAGAVALPLVAARRTARVQSR